MAKQFITHPNAPHQWRMVASLPGGGQAQACAKCPDTRTVRVSPAREIFAYMRR